MSHDDELAEQLAAYALDALDDDERAAVDDVLDASPRARAELARYEAVAGLLGEAAATDDLPEGSWDRLAARLAPPDGAVPVDRAAPALTSPVRDLAAERERRTRMTTAPQRGRRVLGGVAAAAAAAALVLGGVALHQRDELDDLRAQAASPADEATAALARPGTRAGTLTSADPAVSVRAVLDERGTAYLFAGALPALPAGRTYQLWTLDAAQPVSLGVLGDRPGLVTVPASPLVRRLAISVEDAPGATAPSAAPVVAGSLT